MKSKKLNLNQIKVRSFVATLDPKAMKQVEGGYYTLGVVGCDITDVTC
jgi:hypothetical protein